MSATKTSIDLTLHELDTLAALLVWAETGMNERGVPQSPEQRKLTKKLLAAKAKADDATAAPAPARKRGRR